MSPLWAIRSQESAKPTHKIDLWSPAKLLICTADIQNIPGQKIFSNRFLNHLNTTI
jgi:hypothetical protein